MRGCWRLCWQPSSEPMGAHGFMRKTKKKRVTVVNARGDKAVHKIGGAAGGEGG